MFFLFPTTTKKKKRKNQKKAHFFLLFFIYKKKKLQDVHAARAAVESATGLRAACVYGALPPETRRSQARAFNDPGKSGVDVLVASDAVGMGLNLNIRRVVFTTLAKREGKKKRGEERGGWGRKSGAAAAAAEESAAQAPPPSSPPPDPLFLPLPFLPSPSHVPLPPSAVRQIAGRAGRASSPWPEGLATCLRPEDMGYLRAALSAPPDDGGAVSGGGVSEEEKGRAKKTAQKIGGTGTPSAGLFPEPDQLEAYAGRHPGLSFPDLLRALAADARLDAGGRYFFSQQEAVVAAAELLESVPGLALRERFALASAPASARAARQGRARLAYGAALAGGGPVPLFAPLPPPPLSEVVGGGSGGDTAAAEDFAAAAAGPSSVVPRIEEERAERVFAAAAAAVKAAAVARARGRRKRNDKGGREETTIGDGGGEERPAPSPLSSYSSSSSSSPSKIRTPREVTRAATLLKDAEDAHAIVMLWRWLARRFGEERFPAAERELAEAEAARLASLLDRGLASMAAVSSSPPLPSKRKVKRREKEEEDDEKKKTRAGKVGRKVAGSVSSAATRKRRASSSPSSSPPPPPSASEVTFSLPQQEQGARAVVSPGSA